MTDADQNSASCEAAHTKWAFVFWVVFFYGVRYVLPESSRTWANRSAIVCLGLALLLYDGELNEVLCILPNMLLGPVSRPEASAA